MSDSNSPGSKYSVPNVERTLKIFALLSNNPQGLTISDISRELKFPRNSVFRIMSTLDDFGYVNRDDESKSFSLSLKLLQQGIKALSDMPIVEKAISSMHSLQELYKETVPLGILRGNMGVIVEEVVGTHLFKYVLEPGKLFHLHTSAPGKAILAYLPDDEREKLLNTITYPIFNKRTIANPDKLRKTLKEVKKKGYSVDHAEEVDGMHCLGAPIFNRKGYPVAAIWLTGPSIRICEEDFDKIGKDVRKHADRVSKSLGYNL